MSTYETATFILARLESEANAMVFHGYTTAINKRKEAEHTPTTHEEAKTRLNMGLRLSDSAHRLQDLIAERAKSTRAADYVDSDQGPIRARTHRGGVIVPNEGIAASLNDAELGDIEIIMPLVIEQPAVDELASLGSSAIELQA